MEKVFTHLRFKLDRTQKKVIFYILGITLPLFFFSLYFIQNTAGKELTKFAEEKAFHLETRIISEIKHYLDNASSFTKEASYMLKLDPAKYTTLLPFLKKHLQNNPNIYGSALAIEPDSYLNKTYCKYYYKHNGALKEKWLMPPHYDYLHQEWYSKVKQLKKGMWSKPYFDEGGGDVFMSTFTYPLLDSHQTFLGVVTADIKIDILSEKIQKMTFSKEHFVFVLDKSGFLLSHPDSHYALKQTAFAYAKDLHSKTLSNALQQMLSADKGKYTVTIASKTYTLYSVNVPNSDLKIAVFLNNTALFRPLNELKQKLGIVTFIGIILLLLLIVVILREFKQDIIKKTKLKHEFELATKIQMSFLPKKKNMQTDRYEIHSYLKAAREVGGDLYGYKESGNNIVLYVGDVSGKGIPAALFMMATQILLKNTIETTSDPAEIVTLINKRLLETSQNGMFVTLLVIRYDFINQVLTFCNAGHPPFIIKADQLFSPLPTLHPPVNTFENTVYTNNRLTIKTPFQLICFSDGVTEAENRDKELFGIERVAETLQAEFTLTYLRKEIQGFIKSNPANDDMTILTFTVK